MTAQLRSTPLPPPAAPGAEERERLDRAFNELAEDNRWIDDFIQRLNGTIQEIGRKK
jgi:hypothetical protein